MRILHSLILLAAAPLGGCINTDTAVFVDPVLDTATLSVVTSNPLGTSMSGGFHLKLHLGLRASGPSSVSAGQFEIADTATPPNVIVSPLVLASSPPFPVAVQPDSDVDVALTFDTGTTLLDKKLGADLCASAGVTIRGTLQDSLQDTATPVASSVVHASCQ